MKRSARNLANITGALTLLLALPVAALAQEDRRSPLSGQGAMQRPDYSAEEIEELTALEETVRRFAADSDNYREEAKKLIQHQYERKRATLFNSYESIIVDLEGEQRRRRDNAIARFEEFVRKYPDDGRYTPDAMFRLSELYFERSYDGYFQARKGYDVELDAWDPEGRTPEPTEPRIHYEPTIAMMQRLIVEFPEYRLVDGAYYLLGYCLGEQGEEERAVDVYLELVSRRADSRFSPEVWTRIGEYYFDTNELERALQAYSQVLGHIESPFYDKALYKLAWTHYRLADPELAPDEFQQAVDTFAALLDFNERTKAEGKERGGDLRKESIQYMAISYADEQWGGTDKAVAYLDSRNHPAYERDALIALGDVYFDQTRFDEAVLVYGIVQERFPYHVDAPLVQEKVVKSHERNRNFEAAAGARLVMTANYSEGSPWHEQHKDDEEAIERANALTRNSLYSAALFHHRQAQIHKEAEKIELASTEYGKAAKSYGEYLRRFPHDKQLYELTFYHAECLYYSLQFPGAATQYSTVRDSNIDNKFLEESSFSAILSHENAARVMESRGEIAKREVMTSTERDSAAPIQPVDIPKVKLDAVAASDRYTALNPNSEKIPKILYKAAEVFYVHDQFDPARQRFLSLLEAYPQSDVAVFASNLIIESYLSEKKFGEVEKFTRGLLERPATPGDAKFKNDLVKFKSGAMFKIAEDLAAQEKYQEAADAYVKLLDENPGTEFADSALNNAAVALERVNRFDSASRLYERLVKEHPKSPLADSALFRVGLNAERFFDFERAIAAYLTLIDDYPNSERRADAIYNAALSLENTQEYERSAKQYLRYCKLFPKKEDSPAVCFRAGAVYAKKGEPRRVIKTFQDFIQKYRRTSAHRDRIIDAWLRVGKAHDEMGRTREAHKAYRSAVAEFNRDSDPKSAAFAAEAQFRIVRQDFDEFSAIKFGDTARQQKKTLKRKAETLKKVEGRYMEILRFKQIDWTLASLFRVGQLYQEFADSLINAPCPKEVKRSARSIGATVEEVCDEYRILLEEQAASVEDKAVLAFEKVITRAREFQVANTWTKQTLVQLNKLRRSMYPLQKTAKFHLDSGGVAPPGVLTQTGEIYSAPPEPAPSPEAPAATPADAAAVTAEPASDAAAAPVAAEPLQAPPPPPPPPQTVP